MSLETLSSGEAITFEEAVQAYAQTPEANLQTYEYFDAEGATRKTVKDSFLARTVGRTNPVPGLSPVVLSDLWEQAHRLSGSLTAIEQNVDVAGLNEQAFYELVSQRTAETFFLLQAYRVDDMPVYEPNREYQARALHELGLELYGAPNEVDFYSVTNAERQKAESVLQNKQLSGKLQMIIREYLYLLPPPNPDAPKLYMPRPDTVEHYHKITREIFQGLIDASFVDNQKEYSPEEMKAVFKRGLEYIGAQNWDAKIREGGTNVETDQKDEVIYVGSERKSISDEKFQLLVPHEVGVHVWRRVIGELSNNPLLWNTGLSHYYTSEEGLAVVIEQALKGEAEVRGEQYYQIIGLSIGLDGTPRDFQQVFEVEWRRRMVDRLAQGKPVDDDQIAKARSVAYNNVLRVRRGLPTDIKGVAFTKDLAYYNGNVAMWQLLEEKLLSTAEFKKLLIGKHDPTREDHRHIVDAAIAGEATINQFLAS